VRTPLFLSPGAVGVRQEDIKFESQNGTLRGWWLGHLFAQGVVVFAHGYLMNRSEWTGLAVAAHRAGYACLLFDFHSHGKSASGGIVTVGPKESYDVAAAIEYARMRLPGKRIAVVGSSMGAAAAVLAITHDLEDADALVLDSCYSSLSAAILGWWNFIGGKLLAILLYPTVFVAWAITGVNPFGVNITRELASVEMPVLILHGEGDKLEGPACARCNFGALSEDYDSQLAIFRDANHGEAKWVSSADYEKVVIDFLDATLIAGTLETGTDSFL
jgi:pimeloyl-ACP methyl ester carboxylesterase